MKTKFFLGLCALVMTLNIEAKDFGSKGHKEPIAEEDLADALFKKIQAKMQGKDVEKTLREAAERAMVKGQRPKPVEGLFEAKEYRVFYYDPTYVVKEDIKAFGLTIAKKDQKIDVAKQTGKLDFGYLVFDGDNPKHVEWAKNQGDEFRWVLVNGAPLDLADEYDRWVGFDQHGEFTTHFGIKQIPCRMTPQEKQLMFEEIPLDRKNEF